MLGRVQLLSMGVLLSAGTMSACSTMPSHDVLVSGINAQHLTADAGTLETRKSDDPVCQTFYQNVAMALHTRQQNKQTNAQLLTMGVDIAGALVGLGGLGQLATQTLTAVALSQFDDGEPVYFDPEKPFDAKVITAAETVGCPIPTP